MTSAVDAEYLSALWQRQWPQGPPVAHELRSHYPDRWVRFHSLPGSKRYPATEEEYGVVLHRYHAVLEELFAGGEVYVVTVGWSWEPDGPELAERRPEVHPDGTRWMTLADEDVSDPETRSCTPTTCSPGCSWRTPGCGTSIIPTTVARTSSSRRPANGTGCASGSAHGCPRTPPDCEAA